MRQISDEGLRVLSNTEQQYRYYVDAIKELNALPDNMKWKIISGKTYLYAITGVIEKSLGRRTTETEAVMAGFEKNKEDLTARILSIKGRLAQSLAQYKALNLPRMMSLPAKILREMDERSMLGSVYLVVGTNAIFAYEVESGERAPANIAETEDVDFSALKSESNYSLLSILKKVDQTFEVNSHGRHQASNQDAYEVEVLCSPTTSPVLKGGFVPSPMRGQEWLAMGRPVAHVVAGLDGKPAPIVAPDPRYMALHKLWLSTLPDRNQLKVKKDKEQGTWLLDVIKRKMPISYPMDEDFLSGLPNELRKALDEHATNVILPPVPLSLRF